MARSKRSGGEGVGEAGGPAPDQPVSLSFEGALRSLEGVVSQLESGDMPLEQALEAFENGVKLSRQCAATLDAAERRIEILMAERGGLRTEPFGRAADEGGDEDADDADGEDSAGDERER